MGGLGWAATSAVFLLPMLSMRESSSWKDIILRIGVLSGMSCGVMKGLRAWQQEVRRLLYSVAGFAVFRILGRLLITAYLFGDQGREIRVLPLSSVEAIAGPMGLLLGGLWLAAGPTLLRGGLGALLGLYITRAISFVFPESGELTEQVQLGLLAILTWTSVIPLLSATPVRGMIAAVSAALPGLLLTQAFRLNPSSGDSSFFFSVSLLSFLLAMPLAGLAHARRNSSETVPLLMSGTNASALGMLQLVRTGVVGSTFTLLIVGLVVFIGNWLTPFIKRIVTTLPGFPVMKALPLSFDFAKIQFDAFWIAALTFYASIFAVSRLSRGGIIYSLYRFVRFLVLLLMCCIIALLMEQAFETALRDWPAFLSFGKYLLSIGYGLPVGALMLGIIFAVPYTGDRMPVFLAGLGFAIWFAQIILLSGALAFVGGVAGLWAGSFFKSFLDNQGSGGIYGMSWQQALPLAGSYIGFFAGICRALLKWLNGDLGMVVSEYRRVVQRYSSFLDSRMDRLVQLCEPGWVTVGFGCAAIWAMWQFLSVMAPALVRRF